jgi:hypothetical protein
MILFCDENKKEESGCVGDARCYQLDAGSPFLNALSSERARSGWAMGDDHVQCVCSYKMED